MAGEHAAAYLQDHHAGSALAVELLEHLGRAHAGTDLGRTSSPTGASSKL